MAKSSIGRRAFGIIAAFSLALTMVAGGLFFAYEHAAKAQELSAELHRVIEAQTPAIVTALWNLDRQELQVLAEGMRNLVYVDYAAIVGEPGLTIASGEPGASGRTLRTPLVHDSPVGSARIGYLDIRIDERRMLQDVSIEVRDAVIFWALILLLETLFIAFLFQRLVTVHLVRAAEHFRRFDVGAAAAPLALAKRSRGDELDVLTEAFNDMGRRLAESSTKKDRALEELRESEERNRSLVENAPDAILVLDPDSGRIVDCNRRAELLFGRPRDEIVQARASELYPDEAEEGGPSPSELAATLARLREGEALSGRRPVRGPGGEILQCEMRATPFVLNGRRLQRLSYLDITDRIKAEEALRASLREKEVLLQEVYHRTKNNMQVIASLLDMKAAEVEDRNCELALREMVGRIFSMSLVHEKLYKSRDLSRIDLKQYVEELVAHIGQGVLGSAVRARSRVEAEEGIVSSIDIAVPCGLVLNELVVNAFRHAFPANREGTVLVRLRRRGPGRLEIVVADDGAGFPEGFDYRSSGRMGIRTVISIVEAQLHGTVEARSEAGVAWTLTIRDDLYERRI